MAQKTSYYNEGDIFEIELENDFKGVGKVLKIIEPSIFIELYRLSPMLYNEGIDKIEKYEPILSIWCTNTGFKKGIWKIIMNEPIVDEIKMPDFYKRDALNHDKFIVIRDNESHEVNKDEIRNAQPYGIFGHEAVRIRYIHELKQCGCY